MKRRQTVKPRAVIAMLAVLLVIATVFSAAQWNRANALAIQVNAGYEKALHETVRLLSTVEIELEKLTVTRDKAQMQELLSTITRQTDAVLTDLAALPIELSSVASAIKFINQLGDFCRIMVDKLASGGTLSGADYDTITTLYDNCVLINGALDDLMVRIELGEDVFGQAMARERDVEQPGPTGEPEQTVFGDAIKFPVLLYDGPFSDGRNTDAFRALTGDDITVDQAQEIAIGFVGRERVRGVRPTGESAIPVVCYEFDLDTDDGTLSIAVTRQGGQVLYAIASRQAADARHTPTACVDAAAVFLTSRGFMDMALSYWQQEGGLVTVNFAARQEGVILYPDLIKVQISMESGLMVGYEARNYLTNHTTRTLDTPALTEEQAAAFIGEQLTIKGMRLCVIPVEISEAYCYEVNVMRGDARYLIYIDVNTGAERAILKVVEDEDGQLAI